MSIKKKLKDALAQKEALRKQAQDIANASEARGEATLGKADVDALDKINGEVELVERSIAVLQKEADRLDADAAEQQRKDAASKDNGAAGGDDKRDAGDDTEKRGLKPVGRVEVVQSKLVYPTMGHQLIAIAEAARAIKTGTVTDEVRTEMRKLEEVNKRGLLTSNEADGGYLLESQKDNVIRQMLFEDSPLLQGIDVIPLGPNQKTFESIMVDDLSRADGVRLGGVTSAWVDEAEGTTDSKVKFVKFACSSGKLMSKARASWEMMQSAPQVEAVLMANIKAEQRFQFAEAVYRGESLKDAPMGILNDKNPALLTVAIESGQTEKYVYANLLKMNNRMIPNQAANYKWFINPEAMDYLPYIYITVGSNSYPVWMPNVQNGSVGTLFGKPVIPCEQMSAVGSLGDIALVNMTQYCSVSRFGGERTDISTQVYFDTDEQAFRVINYFGGKPKRQGVVTPKRAGGTFKMADFITLAGSR